MFNTLECSTNEARKVEGRRVPGNNNSIGKIQLDGVKKYKKVSAAVANSLISRRSRFNYTGGSKVRGKFLCFLSTAGPTFRATPFRNQNSLILTTLFYFASGARRTPGHIP